MRNFFIIAVCLNFIFCHAQMNINSNKVEWINASGELTQLNANFAEIDNYGFIWIATQLGLYKYDGRIVKIVIDKKYPNISEQRIRYLCKDIAKNTIYFQTFPEEKCYSIKENKIKQLNDEDGFFMENETFLSSDHKLYKVILYYKKQNKKYNLINKCIKNEIITNYFFYTLNDNSIVRHKINGLNDSIKHQAKPYTRLLNFDETLLVLEDNKPGIIKGTKIIYNTIKTDNIIKDFINDKFNLIERNSITNYNNTNYLSFKNKIYKIHFKKNILFTEFLFNNPFNELNRLSYLQKENIYIFGSNKNGMVLVKPNYFNCIFQSNKYNYVDYVTVKIKENWYNYNGWYYNPKQTKVTNREISNYNGNMRFLLHYKGNYYYQAANNKLISIVDLKTNVPFKIKNDLSFLTSFTYLGNKLWLSNEKNIGCLENNHIRIYGYIRKILKKNQTINAINSLDNNNNNNILFATTQGVFIHKPFSNKIKYIKGLENINARYIKKINNNSFWVGSYGDGLFIVNNNEAYKVIDKNRNIRTPHAVEEDDFGNLWISTNEGLLTVNKKNAINNILKRAPIESYVFKIKDGLPTDEFNGGSTFPSIYDDGKIGFPSMKGFIWFDTHEIKKNLFNGKILLDSIVLDNKETAAYKNGAFHIKQNTKILTIDFSYGYYQNRENLTISYQFEDQKKWTEITGNSFQIGRYKNGIHKLKIRITTNGFNENQAVVKSINLNFEPNYYETFWFWSIIGILISLLAYISYLLGLNLRKKKEIQLKNKIDERTRELQNVVLELENSKITINESLNEKNILLKEIHHRVKNNLQLIMSILNIQASDKENTTIEGFIEKGQSRIDSMVLIHENLYQKEDFGNIDFETYTESLVKNIRTTFGEVSDRISVQINFKNVFFDIQTSIPLGLIINELVTNSFKHGFPNGKTGQITISIELISDSNYKLIIKDTGIGFPKDKVEKKSIGLELVSLLVLQLKGKLTVDSKNGTVFEILFKI